MNVKGKEVAIDKGWRGVVDEIAWKAAGVSVHDFSEDIYNIGAAVITSTINGVTFFTGVPFGRVGSVIKDAICNYISEHGDVKSTIIDTVVGQFVDVGLSRAAERAGLSEVTKKAVTDTSGLPTQLGPKAQGIASDFVKGICIKNVNAEKQEWNNKELLSASRKADYDAMVNKTYIYNKNEGRGILIIDVKIQKVKIKKTTKYFLGFIPYTAEERVPKGRPQHRIITIPYEGEGDSARFGEPHMFKG